MAANIYTISYDANGGSGAPSDTTGTYGNGLAELTVSLSTSKPTRSGYTFKGWSSSSTASSGSYSYTFKASSGYLSGPKSATVYAVWEKTTNKIYYTLVVYINYDANGGSGGPTQTQSDPVIVQANSGEYPNETVSATVSTDKPTRKGFTFLGWWEGNTKVTTSTLSRKFDSTTNYTYDDNTHAHASASINLTAHWSRNATTHVVNSSGGLDTYRVYIVNSSGGLDPYHVYVVNSSGGLDFYY